MKYLFLILMFLFITSCEDTQDSCEKGEVFNTTINMCVLDACLKKSGKCEQGCLLSTNHNDEKILVCTFDL